jgi:hypothetical protein
MTISEKVGNQKYDRRRYMSRTSAEYVKLKLRYVPRSNSIRWTSVRYRKRSCCAAPITATVPTATAITIVTATVAPATI